MYQYELYIKHIISEVTKPSDSENGEVRNLQQFEKLPATNEFGTWDGGWGMGDGGKKNFMSIENLFPERDLVFYVHEHGIANFS